MRGKAEKKGLNWKKHNIRDIGKGVLLNCPYHDRIFLFTYFWSVKTFSTLETFEEIKKN